MLRDLVNSKICYIFATVLERNPKPEGVLLHNSELTKSGKFHRKEEVIAFCVYMLNLISVYVAWSIILFIFRKVIPEPVSR